MLNMELSSRERVELSGLNKGYLSLKETRRMSCRIVLLSYELLGIVTIKNGYSPLNFNTFVLGYGVKPLHRPASSINTSIRVICGLKDNDLFIESELNENRFKFTKEDLEYLVHYSRLHTLIS